MKSIFIMAGLFLIAFNSNAEKWYCRSNNKLDIGCYDNYSNYNTTSDSSCKKGILGGI